jgi:hypothetical protein
MTGAVDLARHVPLGPRLPGWKRHANSFTDVAERAERAFARYQLMLALNRGEVVRPECCQRCGRPPRFETKLSAHHTDYRKPLQVSWLCHWCHTWANQTTKMVYLTLYGLPLIGNIDWRWKAGIK